jgi:hypothetical protein
MLKVGSDRSLDPEIFGGDPWVYLEPDGAFGTVPIDQGGTTADSQSSAKVIAGPLPGKARSLRSVHYLAICVCSSSKNERSAFQMNSARKCSLFSSNFSSCKYIKQSDLVMCTISCLDRVANRPIFGRCLGGNKTTRLATRHQHQSANVHAGCLGYDVGSNV